MTHIRIENDSHRHLRAARRRAARRTENLLGIAVFVVLTGLGGALYSALSDMRGTEVAGLSAKVGSAQVYAGFVEPARF